MKVKLPLYFLIFNYEVRYFLIVIYLGMFFLPKSLGDQTINFNSFCLNLAFTNCVDQIVIFLHGIYSSLMFSTHVFFG
jgi:hypothetical protein